MEILKKIAFFFYVFLYWTLFFVFVRVVFLLFHATKTFSLPFSDILAVFRHGLKMDLSAAGYLMIIPVLYLLVFGHKGHKVIFRFVTIYAVSMTFLLSLLAVVDMDIYKYWGFHLDTTPLTYLGHIKEAIASVSGWEIFSLLLLMAIIFAVSTGFYFVAYKSIFTSFLPTPAVFTNLIFLFLAGLLILPIRGGTGIAPMNAGQVYFHVNTYANHAAINYFWNLGNSLVNMGSLRNPYACIEKEKAEARVQSLYQTNAGSSGLVLSSSRPNILFIILESFTAKIIEPLGGEKDVTPCFNRLCKEGILFSHVYASGDRSEKAMVSIFSGFPAQPQKTIIIYPSKIMHLPSVGNILKKEGYHLQFYYGGNIDFASMKSYFISNGFDRLITQDSFPVSARNSKWGVHDHFVFEKLYDDLQRAPVPFLYAFFTLSNHEPFDIPVSPRFGSSTEEQKFLSAAYYTDSVLGSFIARARQCPWWKNTLVVLIADHGSWLPGHSPHYAPEKFHIPMLWLGGALSVKDTVVVDVCSQTDLAATLLHQLKLSTAMFPYSRNIFSPCTQPFAYYSFNNGFGFITPSCRVVYDYTGQRVLLSEGEDIDFCLETGRCYLQVLYDDFLKK